MPTANLPATSPLLTTLEGRQRLVNTVLWLTQGTALHPAAYERQLLTQFVQGELTLDQVETELEGAA
jgi:hypothetical protein